MRAVEVHGSYSANSDSFLDLPVVVCQTSSVSVCEPCCISFGNASARCCTSAVVWHGPDWMRACADMVDGRRRYCALARKTDVKAWPRLATLIGSTRDKSRERGSRTFRRRREVVCRPELRAAKVACVSCPVPCPCACLRGTGCEERPSASGVSCVCCCALSSELGRCGRRRRR